MTVVKMSAYYKWLSLTTLILSIVWSITLVEGTVAEKLGIGLLVNLQFHLPFQFLSKVPFGMYHQIEKDNAKMKILAHGFFKVFSLLAMVVSLIGLVSFLISVIINSNYERLFAIMTFIAVFLGGYSSYLKFHESQSTLHQQER